MLPHITAIGTAVPGHDIHPAFVDWAESRLDDPREARLFRRMVARSEIAHRWSVLPPGEAGGTLVMPGGFYHEGMPPTSQRMARYAEHAPDLAIAAIRALPDFDPRSITHLVAVSCTGFVAPGIDQIIAGRLGLRPDIERTLVGFMGCYGAVSGLRTARHIVRSEPAARVLVVSVELSTVHLNIATTIEPLLAMLLFGDGAAAAMVSAEPRGVAIEAPFSAALPASEELITWHIGDDGFRMHLSGAVPGRIAAALGDDRLREAVCGGACGDVDGWAVHAGGRTILDAVEKALALPGEALAASRSVLRDYGNMSSATLMFALARLMRGKPVERGVALAFGPGLAAEGFRFRSAA